MHAKQLEWVEDACGDFEASGFWGIFQVVHSESGEGFTASLNDSNNYEGYGSEDFPTADEGKAHCQSLLEKQVQKALGFVDWAGKKTLKELANFLGMNVAVEDEPIYGRRVFASPTKMFLKTNTTIYGSYKFWALSENGNIFQIPSEIVDFKGDWTTSLTLPDGWETKVESK